MSGFSRDFSTEATDEHYEEEFDLRLSIKVVESLDDAILFVNRFLKRHSESIITEDKERADGFYGRTLPRSLNASTRFTDGFEFGLGARSESPPTAFTHGDLWGLRNYAPTSTQVTGTGNGRPVMKPPKYKK